MILLFFQVWNHNIFVGMFVIAHSILLCHWSSLIWGLCCSSSDLTHFKLAFFVILNKNKPISFQFNFIFLILSASPLVSVLFRENRHLIMGSADGQVSDWGMQPLTVYNHKWFFNTSIQAWCFSLHDDLKCHLVTKIDLEKLEKRYKGDLSIQQNSDRAFLDQV